MGEGTITGLLETNAIFNSVDSFRDAARSTIELPRRDLGVESKEELMNKPNTYRAASRRIMILLLAVLTAVTACNRDGSSDDAQGPKVRRIAVIPKSTAHVFWNSVEAGARQAAAESDVEIIWKAPVKESDRAGQIQLVQQLTADNVDGIVLAPLDSRALVGPVRAATRAGVPVVIIDSGLEATEGTDYVSYVATDNELGGRLAGEQLLELLDGQGKVVLLRYAAGSASTTEREAGFLSAIENKPRIQVISANRFAGTTSGEAQVAALNMMDLLRQAEGIFCPNESSTEGMLLALRKEGLAGKVKFVGFDASPPLVEALDNREIDALIVQHPFKMGYTGVRTLINHLDGQKFKRRIDTGVAIATRDNRDRPEIKALLP